MLAEAGQSAHRHGKRRAGRVGPARRLARIGSLPADFPDEAVKEQTLVLVACTIIALSVVWVLTSFRST
jgi:hypothetical protein